MAKIIIDTNQFVVYQYVPTSSLIAFDLKQVAKIRQLLAKHGKIFHQISPDEKLCGELLEKNQDGDFIASGNYEVARLCDLELLPLFTRLFQDLRRILGIK